MQKRTILNWMRQYLSACFAFVLCLVLTYHIVVGVDLPSLLLTSGVDYSAESSLPTIVIDAGHGGEDCGAIGVNGVYEKEINMQVARYLAANLRAAGCYVIMTRTEDHLLYDPQTVQKGHKKIDDLANRAAITAHHENAVLVSIHMNSFPSQSVSGLQVWYETSREESKRLADAIQQKFRSYLQADCDRVPKSSNGNMYLLDYAACPAVLVECGFLTNPAECDKLSDSSYQKQLSFVLFCAMMEYINPNL